MHELTHEQVIKQENTEKQIMVVPNGATIELQAKSNASGWVSMNTYTTNDSLELKLKPGIIWRLSMSDGGAAAKAYMSGN